MIDIQQYLKRVNNQIGTTNSYVEANNGYVNTPIQQPTNFDSNLPQHVYKNDGSVDYKKLESFYRSRGNVSEVMTAWSPVDKYVHAISGNSDTFTWDQPILLAEPFSDAIEKIQTSSSVMTANDIDNLLYHTLTPEYQDKFAELLSQTPGATLYEKINNLTQHGSGIITSADFQDLNTAVLNARLVTKTTKANILAQFFETIPTNDLIVPFDEFDGPTVQEDLAELEIPRTVQGKYTGFNVGLKKDGWHIAWTRFFEGIGRRRNIIADHLNALRNDFDRVINERIAVTLTQLVDVGGASWSAFAAPGDLRNQNNPLTVLNTVRATLKANGYPAQFTLSNLRVAQDYINNTYVKGSLTAQPAQMGEESTMPFPQYGWRHGIDDVLVDSSLFVLNENALVRLQGAVINITYVENKSQVFGAIGYNHNNVAIKKSDAGRQITGIV